MDFQKIKQFFQLYFFEGFFLAGFILLIMMQVQGAGIFGDYAQFYYSGWYYFHNDMLTYSFGSLFDLFQHTKEPYLLKHYQMYTFRYMSPPNTSPILYLLLTPLFFISYWPSAILFMSIGVGLSIYLSILFAKKYELDIKVMLFLLIFSFAFITNIQISQLGLYVYSLVLAIFLVENKWVKLLLLAILINLKVFFGLILVYFFLKREFKNLFLGIGATVFIGIISFKFDLNLINAYLDVLQTNLPVRIAYNQSVIGLASIFTDNRLLFLIYAILLIGLLLIAFKKYGNTLNVFYFALLLNPLSLIYYNSVYLIMIMFLYKEHKIKALLLYMMINIPLQLTAFNTLDVLKVMPTWYVISMVAHFVGLILILKESSKKDNLNVGIEQEALHILNFNTKGHSSG